MPVVDGRNSRKDSTADNRKKFLDRYKQSIKDKLDRSLDDVDIKDVMKDKHRKVKMKDIREPKFVHDPESGKKHFVSPGNDKFNKGDSAKKPDDSGEGKGRQGSNEGEAEDEFTFTLTKEEFFDIYFSDMALPNYIKENFKVSNIFKRQRAGYTKTGIPARLNVKKTFENAIARRLCSEKEDPPFLDDEDVRYDYYTQIPYKQKKAAMFCLMDVSASMGEFEKTIAKKFFLLLYLFLDREYDNVDIIFIRHTHEAKEVDEDTFFHSKESGGTLISEALALTDQIIEERYNLNEVNIYVSQVSDGDNWSGDDARCIDILCGSLLSKIQYFAYIEVTSLNIKNLNLMYGRQTYYNVMEPLSDQYDVLNIRRVSDTSEVFPVMRDLFKKV